MRVRERFNLRRRQVGEEGELSETISDVHMRLLADRGSQAPENAADPGAQEEDPAAVTSVAVAFAGWTDVDFASGDWQVGCPYCFVTVPRYLT
jgi:hypothetical protein